MIGPGTLVNVAAIIVGDCLSTLFRGGLKEHYQTALPRTLGLSTLFIGGSGALLGLLEINDGTLATQNSLGMILPLVLEH